MTRTPEELTDAATHIAYEYGEFVRCAGQIDGAFLEASLLHARNLIEFLIGRGRRHPNDITPDDFVDGWVPPDTEETHRLKQALPEIDQHLSHLSWERVDWRRTKGTKYWDYAELYPDLTSVYLVFVALAREQVAPGAAILANAVRP